MNQSLEQNLSVMWSNSVRRFGDKECLRVCKDGDWRSTSYKKVDEYVRNFALGLLDLGFKKGDRLALLSENRPKWAYVDLAVQAAGGVLAAVYHTSTARDVEYIIRDSGSRVVAVSNYFQLKKILQSKKLKARVEHIIIFDPIHDLTGDDARVLSFSDVENRGKAHTDPGVLDRSMDAVKRDDLATLIYTSGATGIPKGVMLTHANLLSNAHEARKLFGLSPEDVTLSILPLAHSLERLAGHFAPLSAGASIAYAESIAAMAENLLAVKPTVMVGVPRIFEKMHARISRRVGEGGRLKRNAFSWALEVGRQALPYSLNGRRVPAYLEMQGRVAERLVYSRIRRILGGRMRFMISGGAPLVREVAEFFCCAGVPIYEGYGLTETSPIVSANYPGGLRLGTVGRPLPGVELRIARDGEILVRGPNVMKGYYHLPEDTREAMAEGWLHTGDIGGLDEDGYLSITGRKKNIIVTSGGKNVAPRYIEHLLTMDRYITRACVVGDRRPFLTAVIVPDMDEVGSWAKAKGLSAASAKELVSKEEVRELIRKSVDKVNTQLARFETVNDFILTEVDFSEENGMLTPTMKVRRKGVNKRFSHEIDQLY